MLFLLSSEVQSGKTRWLEALVDGLRAQGVSCAGVLAPGVWRPLDDTELAEARAAAAAAGERPESVQRFEKLGIDNVLLPSGERIAFGRRTDLAQAEGSFDAASQSGRAQLGWTIFDEALRRVNEHCAALERAAFGEDSASCALQQACLAGAPSSVPSGLLVVDEIGRLELQHGGGLVDAMGLLKRGPSAAFPHALVVVRSWLADAAEEALGSAWGHVTRIAPDAAGTRALADALGAQMPLAHLNDNSYH